MPNKPMTINILCVKLRDKLNEMAALIDQMRQVVASAEDKSNNDSALAQAEKAFTTWLNDLEEEFRGRFVFADDTKRNIIIAIAETKDFLRELQDSIASLKRAEWASHWWNAQHFAQHQLLINLNRGLYDEVYGKTGAPSLSKRPIYQTPTGP